VKKTILKLTITSLAVGLLLLVTDISDVLSKIRRANGLVIAVSILSIWVAQAISSLRWQWILRADGANVPLGFLFISYMVGMFANALLPTSIGGDIVKTYDVYQRTKDISLSITSVFMERFSGLLVLLGLSWAGVSIACRLWAPSLFWGWIIASAGACLLVLAMFKCGVIDRIISWAEKGMFARLARLVRKCAAIIAAYRNRKLLIFKLIIISIPVQLLTIVIYQMIGASLAIEIPFIYYLFGVPLIVILSLLPISLGGLGVREAAGVFVFGFAGLSPEAALSLSVLFTAVTYLASLLGAVFLILRKGSLQEISQGYSAVTKQRN